MVYVFRVRASHFFQSENKILMSLYGTVVHPGKGPTFTL